MDEKFRDKIKELEKLAGKATQGKWELTNIPDVTDILESDTRIVVGSTNKFKDAAYIAAANPAMIQEMIAEMWRLEKEADWLANVLAWLGNAFENSAIKVMPIEIQGIGNAEYWREAARKAVEEKEHAAS